MNGLDEAIEALGRHADRLVSGHRTPTPDRPGGERSDSIAPAPGLDAFGCFTRVFASPSAAAEEVGSHDTARPLDGISFAVKDLFDVAGCATTAGAGFRRYDPPARTDAEVVRRLKAAGAVLVATCNMDEFAYGFSTVNAAYGVTRNPHGPDRLAGGSSGGSAAAVAAGLVPLALGSDTNGSIRVPASLCGVYGLRPTHGALPMAGVFPFVDALDVPGPLAGSLTLLRRSFEVMAARNLADQDPAALRLARLDGWFVDNADSDANESLARLCAAMAIGRTIEWPDAARARSAAYVLTAAEGGARHLANLTTRPEAFDPAVRDRLLAGTQLPAPALIAAQRFAAGVAATMARFWDEVDVVVAPATPCTAPHIDQHTIEIAGEAVSARANLGILTQPIGLAGCPVLAAPLLRPGRLPLGIQLIAAPGREDRLFALAARLEAAGLTGVTPPGAA